LPEPGRTFRRGPLADRDELRTRPGRRFQQTSDLARFSSWRPKWQKSTGPEKGGRQRRGGGRFRQPIGAAQSPATLGRAAVFLAFSARSTKEARVLAQAALAEQEGFEHSVPREGYAGLREPPPFGRQLLRHPVASRHRFRRSHRGSAVEQMPPLVYGASSEPVQLRASAAPHGYGRRVVETIPLVRPGCRRGCGGN
jgi:hypothetical protein